MSNERLVQLLVTGKQHVSYSEVVDWVKCPYRHKLRHIDRVDLSKPVIAFEFGTAMHASCEDFINTRMMKYEIFENTFVEACREYASGFPEFDDQTMISRLLQKGRSILAEVPDFFDENFIEWQSIDAEEQLYESINVFKEHVTLGNAKFKGFIDAVIKCKDKRGNERYWIIDFKTTTWGWKLEKKQDFLTAAQLALYKIFWSQKHNIDLEEIRCAFLLLKKDANDGTRCELLPVSVGPKTRERADKMLKDMLLGIDRRVALKNRGSCLYCEYKGTSHCS